MNLKHLTDKTLLQDTKQLAQKEREISLHILHHFKEIERRKLFSELGYSSLFDYAVKELGYSDAAAIRRIKSARLLSELPNIEKKVESGELSLTNLAMAVNLFKNEDISNKREKLEILAKIENTTKKECEKVLLEYATPSPLPKEVVKQTTSEVQTIKINLSNETVAKLDELKGLMAHDRLNSDHLYRKIFESALIHLKEKKFKINARNPALAPSPVVKRYISAAIKKTVFERDKGKCVKCGSKHWLQFDHIKPYSMGGISSLENLRLLCSNCNQRSGIAGRIVNKAQRIV